MEEVKKTSKPKKTKEVALKTLVTFDGVKVIKGDSFSCSAKDKAHFKKCKAI